jgi:hypothetical protein
MIHEGLARIKATGAEVVLIDPQYAPRVIAKPMPRPPRPNMCRSFTASS